MTTQLKVISAAVLQETLQYLANQPYRDVAMLIQVLSKLPDVQQEPAKPIIIDKRKDNKKGAL